MCKKLIYVIPVIFILSLCLMSSVQAQNIVWCSENLDVDEDGLVDDWEWVELLESVGYTVYSEPGVWADLDDEHIEILNNADLVIFSRGSNSGGYNQEGEPEIWNSIPVPLILMNAYVTRNSRWLWIDSTEMVERAASPILEALDVAHPVFTGVELDASNRVQVFDPNVDTGEITFIGTTEVGNGSLIAKAADEDWAFIVEWEPDIEFYEGSGQAPAARRMLFTAGIHPSTGGFGGRYSQTEEGRQLFLNAVSYMLDAPPRVKAYVPNPTPGNIEAPQNPVLSWNGGVYADTHNVYFGTVFEDVNDASVSDPRGVLVSENQAETTYQVPETLVFGRTYYWRVDEVNAPPDSSIIKGDTWKFTVINFHVIDNFEDYNDYPPDRIFDTWIDGWGTTTNGATAGYPEPVFADDEHFIETEIVHAGDQALPYFYDNDLKYSEAGRPLADEARDWTRDGVQELSLWFSGYLPEVGSFTEDPAGTFTMTSTGADIWDDHDEFHFAYRELTGVGSITAKVESVQNTNDWAKAGIMIRDTLEPGSPHAMMVVAPNQAVSFQYRRSAGGASEDVTEADHPSPLWLRLERDIAGNILASYSTDGSSWTQLTSDTINMGLPIYIGLVVTSHDNSRICEAVFSNVSFTGTVTEQWVNQDIGVPSNSPQPMYVAVSNSTGEPAVIYNEDTSATVIPTWTEWVVPLQDIADLGVDLTDVDSIAIGVGNRGDTTTLGGTGKLYIDDIRLYLPREPESTP
jgi:hypothetical protein